MVRSLCLGMLADILAALASLHRELAAAQARELGLLDRDGPGSWTHPDLSRMLYADGTEISSGSLNELFN